MGGPLWSSGEVRRYYCLRQPWDHRIRKKALLIFARVSTDPFLPRMRRACKESNTGHGPITIRTPYGLGVDEWADGLEKYAKAYQALDGADNYDIKKK